MNKDLSMHTLLTSSKQNSENQLTEQVPAIYLTETLSELNECAGFFDRLSLSQIQDVKRASVALALEPEESAFRQGRTS